MPGREESLGGLSGPQPFDLLVVGGGATGCGIALDAAARGLKVALVEKSDIAEGTSGRSTKLLHGGVRYLESAVKHLDPVQYRLVRDGLRERGILLRLAPHLSHSIPLVTPLYSWVEVPYVYAGLKLYDLLAGSLNIGHSHVLSASEALASFPMLKARGLKAGVSYWDGQFNDARLAVSLALTAARSGALVVNHAAVETLLKENGKICGAGVVDVLTGRSLEVRARVVVNATGPFADGLRRMDQPDIAPLLTVSSGVHLVLDSRFSPAGTGLLIPKTEDGRVLFILPWEGRTLVGTTDEPAEISEHPLPREEEIEYLVHHISRYFDVVFSRKDIRAAWSGLRPLVSDPRRADTARLSRDHFLEESPSGLLTITGGKWTTYRKMASDTVDYAVKTFRLGQEGPCPTANIPVEGGARYRPDGGAALVATFALDPDVAEHLNRNYGDRAEEVATLAAEGGGTALVPGQPWLEAEVVWGVRREMACRAMDVLARRTPLALLDTAQAAAASPRVIDIMASELGWSHERRAEETRDVRERLATAI